MTVINLMPQIRNLSKRAELSGKIKSCYEMKQFLDMQILEIQKQLNKLNIEESKNGQS